MIVLFANTKGGAGKSTLAVNVAIARALQGRRVMAIDCDRQGTLATALTQRGHYEFQPPVAFASYTDDKALRSQVMMQRDRWDDIILDCGGYDARTLRVALLHADVLLVPYQPKAADTWALANMAELIEEVHAVRVGLRVHAVLNLAKPGYSPADNVNAQRVLAHFPQLPWLDATIVRRDAFASAISRGQCVLEQKPIDRKAAGELKHLVAGIFGGNP